MIAQCRSCSSTFEIDGRGLVCPSCRASRSPAGEASKAGPMKKAPGARKAKTMAEYGAEHRAKKAKPPTPTPEKGTVMAPMSAVIAAVPAGHRVVHGITPDDKDVAIVMRDSTVVTVIDPMGDIGAQVVEDTCIDHNAFCCEKCMGEPTGRFS